MRARCCRLAGILLPLCPHLGCLGPISGSRGGGCGPWRHPLRCLAGCGSVLGCTCRSPGCSGWPGSAWCRVVGRRVDGLPSWSSGYLAMVGGGYKWSHAQRCWLLEHTQIIIRFQSKSSFFPLSNISIS